MPENAAHISLETDVDTADVTVKLPAPASMEQRLAVLEQALLARLATEVCLPCASVR
jgi:hypothetical protein